MECSTGDLGVIRDGVCHVVQVFKRWINMVRWEWAVECETLDEPHREELRQIVKIHEERKRGQDLREYQLHHRLGGLLVVFSNDEKDQVALPARIEVPFEPIEFKRDRERAELLVESSWGPDDSRHKQSPTARPIRRNQQRSWHWVGGILGGGIGLAVFLGFASDIFVNTQGFTWSKLLWSLVIGATLLGVIFYYLSENRWVLDRTGVVHEWQFVLGGKKKITLIRPQDCPIVAHFTSSPPGWNLIFWTDQRIQPPKYGSDEIRPDIVAAADAELQLLIAVWRSIGGS